MSKWTLKYMSVDYHLNNDVTITKKWCNKMKIKTKSKRYEGDSVSLICLNAGFEVLKMEQEERRRELHSDLKLNPPLTPLNPNSIYL